MITDVEEYRQRVRLSTDRLFTILDKILSLVLLLKELEIEVVQRRREQEKSR